jgi:hypothetical protein
MSHPALFAEFPVFYCWPTENIHRDFEIRSVLVPKRYTSKPTNKRSICSCVRLRIKSNTGWRLFHPYTICSCYCRRLNVARTLTTNLLPPKPPQKIVGTLFNLIVSADLLFWKRKWQSAEEWTVVLLSDGDARAALLSSLFWTLLL